MAEGIQETLDVVDAAGVIAAVVIAHLKDGFQPGADITSVALELAGKPEYQAALQKAGENIQKVPAELKDVDLREGFALAQRSLQIGEKVVGALGA